ncbi:molybdopterin-binding protein [Yoonia litorea]|uniref:Molybdenum cofactor cytidylyltransferase n=1 Tax=Yoonia litorea TaxID=1123755 RepID=A0A1I6MCW8_9RHOB|nr:molybdopterin-binding protein [Yoonia litorea]SFS13428.1 molybdenum cofactor cytidylyltransferase [Yoonia litorea]
MKFGKVPVEEAEGAVLAHSLTVADKRLRKGTVLLADDIALLKQAGETAITVAQYDEHDLSEDEAAKRLAAALAGSGIRISQAATGRVNLFAEGPGIVAVDAKAIDAFNAINPMITVATLPPLARVDVGVMVATVKIISYAVAEADVMQAGALASQAIALKAPQYATAALIETTWGGETSAKGETALKNRLARLQVTLGPRRLVAHDTDALVAALGEADADVLFILTASATSDVADVGPSALVTAGGTLTQFGMPVDPGNLLFLGRLGDRPVIGLPGCARSPALNGADWVIERVICGESLTPDDFAKMGVGGLLKEIPSRPKPRAEI